MIIQLFFIIFASMKKELNLTIHLKELKKIVSGVKVEEYRASKDYYHKLFDELNENFEVVKPPEILIFRCANQNMSFFAKLKVLRIRHEKFIDFIPEGFKQGDLAYTIYLGEVLEYNLNL